MGIGKRSKKLNAAALKVARKIGAIDFDPDGSCDPMDVTKHLTSDYIKKKLGLWFSVSEERFSVHLHSKSFPIRGFDKVVEFAEATGKRVAVTDVERIPYTNAARKSTGTDIADQLRKIKELQNEGVSIFSKNISNLPSARFGETQTPPALVTPVSKHFPSSTSWGCKRCFLFFTVVITGY